jgi:hypothetical protein
MEYIKSIKQKLFYFSSPLNLELNLTNNSLIEFLFSLPESEMNNPVSIFLKNLLIKFSEKFLKIKNQCNITTYHSTTFTFYILLFTTILENLQNFENNFSQPQSEKIIEIFNKIKEILLLPFNNKKNSKKNNTSILKIQSQLENDFNNLYNHLFLPEEISLLSILIITNILDSEDLTKPNVFIKSFNTSDVIIESSKIQVRKEFILTTQYNSKIVNFFENCDKRNIPKFFKIGFITDVNKINFMNCI